MATDIVLEEHRILLDAGFVVSNATDFALDNPTRRRGGGELRRAMVHDGTDGLTLNWGRDYPGGVHVNDANLHLRVHEQDGLDPQLPRAARVGDVILLLNADASARAQHDRPRHASLWVCVPDIGGSLVLPDDPPPARWRQVQLGEEVAGTR